MAACIAASQRAHYVCCEALVSAAGPCSGGCFVCDVLLRRIQVQKYPLKSAGPVKMRLNGHLTFQAVTWAQDWVEAALGSAHPSS